MKQSLVSLTNKSILLKTDQTIHCCFLLSSFVQEKSTQMVLYGAKTGFLTRKSGRAEGIYSIFVFVWAAVQSIPKFTDNKTTVDVKLGNEHVRN